MNAEGPSPTRPGLLLLDYFPVLGFVTLKISRNPEARWHARNGLALFAAAVVVGGAATLVGVLVPSLTCLSVVAIVIVTLLYVSIAILAAVQALGGRRLMIPGVSSHADRLSAADRA